MTFSLTSLLIAVFGRAAAAAAPLLQSSWAGNEQREGQERKIKINWVKDEEKGKKKKFKTACFMSVCKACRYPEIALAESEWNVTAH